MYPASMTKMMGLILVCEAIENKKIKLDDLVGYNDRVNISTLSFSLNSLNKSNIMVENKFNCNVNKVILMFTKRSNFELSSNRSFKLAFIIICELYKINNMF